MKKKPGTWNFKKPERIRHGCNVCKHNPIGLCELAGREVPVGYIIKNGTPPWCPKEVKK